MSFEVEPPRRAYQARFDRFAEEVRNAAGRSRRLAHARLVTFMLLLATGVWATEGGGTVPQVLSAAALGGFIVLVVLHARTRRTEQRAAALRDLATTGLARLDRAWRSLPVWDAAAELPGHAYANDLDLFGMGSLTQLLGEPGSPQGRSRVIEWLVALPEPAETRARQAAVRELSDRIDYRDELTLRARPLRAVPPEDIHPFLIWCEERSQPPAWLYAASLVVPAALWLAVALRLTGVWSVDVWLVPAIAALALTFGAPGTHARRTFARVFQREPLFRHVPELLSHIAEAEYTSPRMQRIRAALHSAGASPRTAVAQLRRVAHLSDVRRSILYLPIQLLTLWDQHVLRGLYAWRDRNGAHVRAWFDALADAEALSALATLAHDQPGWCYPEIDEDTDRIEATSLGHPLLSPHSRVDNDVTIGPPGTFLLVTGSNMSGKSTLLRSIGTNIILARAGAPACARSLTLPRAVPCASIRVQDSLARGVSFFMAELQRMREIVASAESAARDGWICVFLLDEMLHGTNSAERRIAARVVIQRLVGLGAIGAVSTHDLQLGAEPALRDLAVRIHFTETVTKVDDRPVMTFDYRVLPGDATSTNALVLLELMGLAGSPDKDIGEDA